jgi:hypothetical protein
MLESLDINGRTYIPCETAALEVGYAAAYIERLARGKWIDASFVQGQCFVEVGSLMHFIAATEAEAGDQLQAAQRRLQAEEVLVAYEEKMNQLPVPTESWMVIGQVGVVTMCGVLLGFLSLGAIEAELTWQEFSDGVSQTASVLRERVVPVPEALPLREVGNQANR